MWGRPVSILFAQNASEVPNAQAHQAAGREEQNQFEAERLYWNCGFSSPPANRNKLSSNRCSQEVAGQHETNNIDPVSHNKFNLRLLDCSVCLKRADIRFLAVQLP